MASTNSLDCTVCCDPIAANTDYVTITDDAV